MGIIYAIKGRSADGVDIQLATFDNAKQGAKGFPAKLTIGEDVGRMCTVYYNETRDGDVIGNLYGPIPKKDEGGRPITSIVDGQERYEWMTYKDPETQKDRWVEAPLGTISVKQGNKSGQNYIFTKLYHEEALVPMARLSYEIKNIPEGKEQAIESLNKLQREEGMSMLLSLFPASPIAAKKLETVFKKEFVFTPMPSSVKKPEGKEQSPSPSPGGM
jgi:hypothetical protein